MTDRPKVVTMNPAPDKMTEAVENLRRNMNSIIDYHKVSAEIRYKFYLSHINAGFTKAQALELSKQIW